MHARALCAPVFFSLMLPQTGRCAPPPPWTSHCCFLFDPQKYIKSIELGPPTSKLFSFHWTTEAKKYEFPCPPPRSQLRWSFWQLFWGQIYLQVRPYAPIFFPDFSFFLLFLDLSFWLFSSFHFLLFNFFLFFSSYPSLLISSYSSRRCFSLSSYSSLIF